MVNCDPDDRACYDAAENRIEHHYFGYAYYYSLIQGAIAIIGVLLLFLRHRKSKVSVFMIAISILLICSSIAAYSFARSTVIYYNWLTVYHNRYQWMQLQAPCRDMSVFLSTWAHWLFAEKYLQLALVLPFLLNKDRISSPQDIQRKRRVLFWTIIGINVAFYSIFVAFTVK